MRPNDIHAQLQQRPFVPFRMCFSDGSLFEVRHPEMARVSRTVIAVAVYNGGEAELPERFVFCDPVHVVRLEPVIGLSSNPPTS